MKFLSSVIRTLLVLLAASAKGVKVSAAEDNTQTNLRGLHDATEVNWKPTSQRLLESCDKPSHSLSCEGGSGPGATNAYVSVCRSPPQDDMNPCWLKDIPGEVKINQISLPGTHDTMTWPDSDSLFNAQYSGIGNAVTVQVWSLEIQLDAGIRSLDIRILDVDDANDPDRIQLVHGDVWLNGRYFKEDVWDVATAWLANHPSEFIVMHIQTDSSSGDYPWDKLNRIMGSTWEDTRLFPDEQDKWPMLKDARGKIWFSVGVTEGTTLLFTEHGIDDIDKMKAANEFARVGVSKSYDGVFPLHWAQTRNKYIDRLPNVAHPVGIIHMDFPSEKGIKEVIQTNFFCVDHDIMCGGEQLPAGRSQESRNGKYRLVMQNDGNLVVYETGVGARSIWASNTEHSGADHAIMQTDGNLVVYQGPHPKWASNTSNCPGCWLRMQDDGNLVVYDPAYKPLWASMG